MRRLGLALVTAGALLLGVCASAEAGGRGGGPSMGGHNGFETFTHTTAGPHLTTTQERLPPGWAEGKAAWKSGLQSSNPILTTRPRG